MAIELEAKFKISEPAELRRRLAAIGAARQGTVLEQNRLYDFADLRLRQGRAVLRLRTAASGSNSATSRATLTFKQAQPDSPPRISKEHMEHETMVAEPDQAAAILAGLGLKIVLGYEKRRETWLTGACEVALDELPQLGWFVEIEGPDETEVGRLTTQLSLAPTAAQPTYPALTAQHGVLEADGARWLRFS